MSTALVTIEGVLGRNDQMRGFHPDPRALLLVRTLRQGFKIVLLSSSSDTESTKYWLMLNGILLAQTYERLIIREPQWEGMSPTTLTMAQIVFLQSAGEPVELVLSSDPLTIANVVSEGVQGLLWASPTYLRPEHQPGGAKVPEPWDDIVTRVESQKQLLASDPRRSIPEGWNR